jgi:hypothetical protein
MVQNGSPDVFRDAIRFRQGTEILIQRLAVGQVADVLSLSAKPANLRDLIGLPEPTIAP